MRFISNNLVILSLVLCIVTPVAAQVSDEVLMGISSEVFVGVTGNTLPIDIVDPIKAPGRFVIYWDHWKRPLSDGLFPRQIKGVFTKIPCPGEGPSVCYVMDIYDCSWMEFECNYLGSQIMGFDYRVAEERFAFYLYNLDGTLGGRITVDSEWVCFTVEPGQTDCFDHNTFKGLRIRPFVFPGGPLRLLSGMITPECVA